MSKNKTPKRIAQYIFLFVVTAIFFAPIAYLFIGSLKPNDQVLAGLSGFIPRHLSFRNYAKVFETFNKYKFWVMIHSSFYLSLGQK